MPVLPLEPAWDSLPVDRSVVEFAEGDLDVVDGRVGPWRTGVGTLGDLIPDTDPPLVGALRVRDSDRTRTSAPESLPAALVSTWSVTGTANTEPKFRLNVAMLLAPLPSLMSGIGT